MVPGIVFLLLMPHAPTGDLEFQNAMEQSVMRMAPQAMVPQPYRDLIDAQNASHYRDREAASRRLRWRIGGEYRWLMWGRRSPSAEVAYRCNNVLKRVHYCRGCMGKGECFKFSPSNKTHEYSSCVRCGMYQGAHEGTSYPKTCLWCQGSGTMWPKDAFE
jgi:hypothetical protein